MFWIEESPTSALDDNDSDVPFDECPGKPMACEEEIELIIRPPSDDSNDEDDHPYKALDVTAGDEDTWPETCSAYGGTTSNSTHVSSTDYEAVGESDDTEDDGNNNNAVVPLETIDDDATQVMGENHTILGPEDERTLISAQDASSFVYLAAPSSSAAADDVAAAAAAESCSPAEDANAPEDQQDQVEATTNSSALLAQDESSSSSPMDENQDNIQEVDEPEASHDGEAMEISAREEEEEESMSSLPPPASQETAALASVAPVLVVDDEDDAENDAPDLVSEPIVAVDYDDNVGDNDDAENDVASMSEESETKPLNEMNQQEEQAAVVEDDNAPEEEESDHHHERDWYDQWEPLEETADDGISCISNMFASIQSDTCNPNQDPMSLAPSPTMITVFSAESQFALKSQQEKTSTVVAPQEALSHQASSLPRSPGRSKQQLPSKKHQVILIFEGEDDNENNGEGETSNMTLTEFLNANCMQGTRKERRRRIMERQKSALSRITPIVASSAPGSDIGVAPGFLEHLFDNFDSHMEQLQNMWGL